MNKFFFLQKRKMLRRTITNAKYFIPKRKIYVIPKRKFSGGGNNNSSSNNREWKIFTTNFSDRKIAGAIIGTGITALAFQHIKNLLEQNKIYHKKLHKALYSLFEGDSLVDSQQEHSLTIDGEFFLTNSFKKWDRVKKIVDERERLVHSIVGDQSIGKTHALLEELKDKFGIFYCFNFKKNVNEFQNVKYEDIQQELLSFTLKFGYPPILLVEDLSGQFEFDIINKTHVAENLSTMLCSLVNDGVACVIIVDSKDIQSIIRNNRITGHNGRLGSNIRLDPMPKENILKELTEIFSIRNTTVSEKQLKHFVDVLGDNMFAVNNILKYSTDFEISKYIQQCIEREKIHLCGKIEIDNDANYIFSLLREKEYFFAEEIDLLKYQNTLIALEGQGIIKVDYVSTIDYVKTRFRFKNYIHKYVV